MSNLPQVRVMIVREGKTKKEVYGQFIHDAYLSDDNDPVPSTDEVVRAYMQEFCSDVIVRDNVCDSPKPLPNSFQGRVAIVQTHPKAPEYMVLVRTLKRPLDEKDIWKYHKLHDTEWNAALAAYRGLEDPRVLEEPDLAEEQDEIWWSTFKRTVSIICLAMVATFVGRTVLGSRDSD